LEVACFAAGEALSRLLRRSPGTLVAVRPRALPALFPTDLAAGVLRLPYPVARAVALPAAVRAVGVRRPAAGEVLLFARGALIARLPDAPGTGVARLRALLCAGLSPWLGRKGAPAWDVDETDPRAGVPSPVGASFEQAHAAWQRRLALYHPDRFRA
jgi:hypothetical protein